MSRRFSQMSSPPFRGSTHWTIRRRRKETPPNSAYLASYPFHPDLTEVLYTKWTQLEGFQRTRGVLRTFALALRDAVKWDQSPLVGPNVFLTEPGKPGVSAAAREVSDVASKEEYEGKRQEWDKILEGELAKARAIQDEVSGLNFREVEQAVLATFLHSQPVGHRASLRDVTLLVSPTRPDKIQLEKALIRWAELSHFLDDQFTSEANPKADGRREVPKFWRLGSKPNLRQMHSDACDRIQPELVEAKLLKTIEGIKNLTAGTTGTGYKVKVHMLPDKPNDVGDDGEFHFAVLGPKAASSSGNPSAEARRYLDETTAADRPRVHRNAVVLAVPSRDGLEIARTRIRDYLAWEEVQSQLKEQKIDDPIRLETLILSLDTAKKEMPKAVQQAYNIVVTVSEPNEVQAFKLNIDSSRPLFDQIREDTRSRIQETAISFEALLPEGPYDLWRSGETSRRVKDLVGAFAQFPQLPKMLNRQAILDTILQGCREGQFVLRLVRPDKSFRTIWRQTPTDDDLKNPALEVVLPEHAELSHIEPSLIAPKILPGLWQSDEMTVADLKAYFAGGRVVKLAREGYEEPVTIPKADAQVVEQAVHDAVKAGMLWLTSGPTSLLIRRYPAGGLDGCCNPSSPAAGNLAEQDLTRRTRSGVDRGDDHGTNGRRRSLGPRQEDPAVGHCPKRDRCGDPCTTGGADTGIRSLGMRYQRCEPGETQTAGEDPAPTAAPSTTASSGRSRRHRLPQAEPDSGPCRPDR